MLGREIQFANVGLRKSGGASHGDTSFEVGGCKKPVRSSNQPLSASEIAAVRTFRIIHSRFTKKTAQAPRQK